MCELIFNFSFASLLQSSSVQLAAHRFGVVVYSGMCVMHIHLMVDAPANYCCQNKNRSTTRWCCCCCCIFFALGLSRLDSKRDGEREEETNSVDSIVHTSFVRTESICAVSSFQNSNVECRRHVLRCIAMDVPAVVPIGMFDRNVKRELCVYVQLIENYPFFWHSALRELIRSKFFNYAKCPMSIPSSSLVASTSISPWPCYRRHGAR